MAPDKKFPDDSFRIKQSESYEGDDWWSWSVWVDGPKDKLKDVDHVEYTLHPSFPNPVRTISTKGNKFKLKTGGWGVFPIYARIVTKDGRIETVEHDLKLHYPDGKPNTE